MNLLLGIMLILGGILLLVSPHTWFDLTESWKHSSAAEPSNLWILSTCFGGIMCILAGILGIVLFFAA